MGLEQNLVEVDEEEFVDELKPGTQLMLGQYTIEEFLASGGFGITYLARDSLNRRVVIKECFPGNFCRRQNCSVTPRSRGHQESLRSIVRLFSQEAISLSKADHPNVVRVHQVFEENNTAYMALDFVDGRDLLDIITEEPGSLSPEQIESYLLKTLDAIGHVHKQGILHRDISPDNIIVTEDGEPVLIDFGAAREQTTDENASRLLSSLRVVKDGYSPQEFYIAGSAQDESCDLYSLAASFYHIITGELPPDSQNRLTAYASGDPDPYVPLAIETKDYSRNFSSALDKAMSVLPRDRMQTAEEWIDAINGKAPARVISRRATQFVPNHAATASGSGKSKVMPLLVATTAIALVGVGGFVFMGSGEETSVATAPKPASPEAEAGTAAATPERASVEAPATAVVSAPVEAPVVAETPTPVETPTETETPATAPVVTEARETPEAPVVATAPDLAPVEAPVVSETPAAPVVAEAPAAVEAPSADAPTTALEVSPVPVPRPARLATPVPAAVPVTELAETPLAPPIAPPAPAAVPVTELAETPAAPKIEIPGPNPVSSQNDVAMLVSVPADAFEPGIQARDIRLDFAARPIFDSSLFASTGPDAAPTAVVTPPEPLAPKPAAIDVSTNWTIGLPFTARQDNPMLVDEVIFSIWGWLQPGTEISSVNGIVVDDINKIPAILQKSTQAADKTQLSIRLGTPEGEREIILPVLQETVLSNGVTLQARLRPDGWEATVTDVSDLTGSELRVGDMITGYAPTGDALDTRTALADLISRELATGERSFPLQITRDGAEMTVSAVTISDKPIVVEEEIVVEEVAPEPSNPFEVNGKMRSLVVTNVPYIPFTLSEDAPGVVSAINDDAPFWLASGVEITALNGNPLTTNKAFLDQIEALTAETDNTDITVNVTVADRIGGGTTDRDLRVFTETRTALLNGLVFHSRLDEGRWVTRVTSAPEESTFRLGDQVVAYMGTGERLEDDMSLKTILERELESGTTRFSFAVLRSGAMWVEAFNLAALDN